MPFFFFCVFKPFFVEKGKKGLFFLVFDLGIFSILKRPYAAIMAYVLEGGGKMKKVFEF